MRISDWSSDVCSSDLANSFKQTPKRLSSGAHLLFEILDDSLEKALGGQPVLVGADQQREIFGHLAALDGRDADLFKVVGEFRHLGRAVELAAMLESAGPGKDRDRKSTRLNSSH